MLSSTSAAPAVRVGARSPVLGVMVSHTTYTDATAAIIDAATNETQFVAAATSVHGVSTAALDPRFKEVLNSFELITPDGQPVRWALNLLHGAQLSERVYGPTLMERVCRAASQRGLGVYLYGGRPETLLKLIERLSTSMPAMRIAGYSSPPFRPLTPEEDVEELNRIRASGAKIVFVGLGCPRQELWAFEHRECVGVPLVCVGAAFDFHAGMLRQAPAWMQHGGLEWLFRMLMEPRRLWRRYAKCVPIFACLVTWQLIVQSWTRWRRHDAKDEVVMNTLNTYDGADV